MNKNWGSWWTRWDLHIHTNASDGTCSCEEILEEAIKKKIMCLAITDHHTVDNVDNMKKIAKDSGVHIISGVEFRTEYGKSSVHIIGLFPDEYQGNVLSSTFLSENVLNPLGVSRSSIICKGREISKGKSLSDEEAFKAGLFHVQVGFRNAANLIHKYGGLVSVHAGSKSNSIDEEMKHDGPSPKNVSIEDSLGPVKEELFRDGYIDICDLTDFDERDFYLKTFNKPSITSSDAHSREQIGENACWIKSELSFEGLRHILAEPDRVSYETPALLDRIRKNPDKFIYGLSIKRTSDASMPEMWFDNLKMNINPGLVAIIGNKGSGKSAIADILALCADSSNQNWSFLTPNKFRMTKPYNRSKQIEASIMWANKSNSSIKTLDLNSDLTQPERVKYIPQNFLETLCTTEDDREFEIELKKIIFQYLTPDQRYGQNSLDGVIEYLTKESSISCAVIKSKIHDINSVILEKESMLESDYRAKLSNELKYKQEQLSNTQESKPQEVKKPDITGDEEAQKAKAKIESLQSRVKTLISDIQNVKDAHLAHVRMLQDLSSAKEKIERESAHVKSVISELSLLLEPIGIDANTIIKFQCSYDVLKTKEIELQKKVQEYSNALNPEIENSLAFQYNVLTNQLSEAEKWLSEPERKYQQYLKEKEEWEKKMADITGASDREGTIKYYQNLLTYIEHILPSDLSKLKDSRKELLKELLVQKRAILSIYNELFSPIVKFISDFHDELREYPIEFDASFSIREFGEHFFDYVNQNIAGSYCGKEQGSLRIKEHIDTLNIQTDDSYVSFPCLINEDLQYDKREGQNEAPRLISSQIKKGHSVQELYDYLYGLEYVEPFFQLKMNGKRLSSLSPGERGALLLLLYLFIDMDDKPLILDQPEENLDNESVYKYLVHFIKKAKEKRQIIMVTHNPNLAVVCDADQVIHMKIDKTNNNVVSFESGAIENPQINKTIVDILEGTYPAFHNRDSKYFVKT